MAQYQISIPPLNLFYVSNLYGKFCFFFDSTISHIGFLLLALAINTEQSIDSFLFYLIQYTITNLNIFLIILALTYITSVPAQYKTALAKYPWAQFSGQNEGGKREDIRYISELKGLFFSNPLLSLSLGICLFSMAGIPPLIGFFSKQFVLYSALQNGYYFISLIAIIVSVISASYYLKIIKVLHTYQEIEDSVLKEQIKSINTVTLFTNDIKADATLDKVQSSSLCPATAGLKPNLEGAKRGMDEMVDNKLVLQMHHEAVNSQNDPIISVESKNTLTNTHSFLISSLTLIILLFFIKPSIILNSTQLLSLSLFYI